MPRYNEVWVFQEGNGLIWQAIVSTETWRICLLKEFTLIQFIGMILNVTSLAKQTRLLESIVHVT